MSGEYRIRRAAVIGAGVMGTGIAAHLANAGYPVVLLDIKPKDAGDDPRAANRLAAAALERALQARPPAFFSPHDAELVTIGNLEDDLGLLADADWVVEAVVERTDVKQQVYRKIAPHLGPDAILSSNTSGLSVAGLAEALPRERRRRFLVTHFFNPPRYLELLELVPGPDTDPEVLAAMAAFGERELGKGIVYAKDTPNFIANRIGCFAMFHAMRLMLEKGYDIAEVDALTGPAIGRPKSATFRTADVVGIDTLVHVADHMYDSLPAPERDLFSVPDFVRAMVERGWLGEKSGQGFYKRVRGEGGTREILMLDPSSMDYVPRTEVRIPSLGAVRAIEDPAQRIATMFAARDRGGEFVRANLGETLLYAAAKIPEIADELFHVDHAMRWGFGWDLGPFEAADAIGGREAFLSLREAGKELPPLVIGFLESGLDRFHAIEDGERRCYRPATGRREPLPGRPRVIDLELLRARGAVVAANDEAGLLDLGDGVLCLRIHTKMNTIGPGVLDLLEDTLERLDSGAWRGLVIGNGEPVFSAGANLKMVLETLAAHGLDAVGGIVRRFQDIVQGLRYVHRPVVAAVRGMTLGGGCEIALAADLVCAAGESYVGLVEVGAGVVPAGGGCMELVARAHETLPEGPDVDVFPLVRRVFETVGQARVSTSARHAQELGLLRRNDCLVMHPRHVLHAARQQVVAIDEAGYRPRRPRNDIRVAGEAGLAALRVVLHGMREGGFLTEYDVVVGEELARVLCGGEVPAGTRVGEQHLLDLEREAFVRLLGDERTQARVRHVLETGKPLRN